MLQISAGDLHNLALTEQGDVLSWGAPEGHGGRLGHGDNDNQPLPKVVAALQHARVVEAVAGPSRSVVRLESGEVRRTDESGGWVGM